METITFFLPYAKPSGGLEVDNFWFYKHNASQITNKDMVYTPMGGSQTMNVMVYTHYEG